MSNNIFIRTNNNTEGIKYGTNQYLVDSESEQDELWRKPHTHKTEARLELPPFLTASQFSKQKT